MKNSQEVLRDSLMNSEHKGVFWSRSEESWESPNEKIKIERAGI
jgi:hypothetical protein